jgi:hypothetical protein
MKLNLDFESTHVEQADSNRYRKGRDGHGRTVAELKGCEGLIVDVNANNLGRQVLATMIMASGNCSSQCTDRIPIGLFII